MQATLIANQHGYRDFDIDGLRGVHRACVPCNIKRGETFNVYCAGGSKFGATWVGTLDRSLVEFVAKHPLYADMLANLET